MVPHRTFLVMGFICVLHALAAQYTLTLNLQNMDPYLGHQVGIRVIEQASGAEVGRRIIPSLESTSKTIVLYVLLEDRDYILQLYADVDGNGIYEVDADHSWEQQILNVSSNRTVHFTPDDMYVPVSFPEPFPYSQYKSVWGGKWHNLTFGSTDSIEASFQITCDSVFGYFMTKGVFGNPSPVEFNYAEPLPPDTGGDADTISFDVPPPIPGTGYVVDGELHLTVGIPNVDMEIIGTVGAKQVHCLYTVYFMGNPFANGYFYVRELEIISSAPELSLTADVDDVHCAGEANGSVTAFPQGGSPGYTYAWSNGTTEQGAFNLAAGSYTVTVTDTDGCTITGIYEVLEPTALVITNLIAIPPSCPGICDGTIVIEVIGGIPPYAFTLSNGSGNPTELCSGVYGITVTDESGCNTTAEVFLAEPDAMEFVSIDIVQPTGGEPNGSIVANVTGGSPPLFYSIDGVTFSATNFFPGLGPGPYCVFVQDGNGCLEKSDTIFLSDITAVPELGASFLLYPNPASGWLFIDSDFPVAVQIIDMTGICLLQTNTLVHHRISILGLAKGAYVVRTTDGLSSATKLVMKQ